MCITRSYPQTIELRVQSCAIFIRPILYPISFYNGRRIQKVLSSHGIKNSITWNIIHKVVCFLLGNSPASQFYMPTFWSTLFHLHRRVGVEWLVWEKLGYLYGKRFGSSPYKYPNFSQTSHSTPTCLWRWNRQIFPKRRHIKFRRRGITQKNAYNKKKFALFHAHSCTFFSLEYLSSFEINVMNVMTVSFIKKIFFRGVCNRFPICGLCYGNSLRNSIAVLLKKLESASASRHS